jgi:hypothetical protein
LFHDETWNGNDHNSSIGGRIFIIHNCCTLIDASVCCKMVSQKKNKWWNKCWNLEMEWCCLLTSLICMKRNGCILITHACHSSIGHTCGLNTIVNYWMNIIVKKISKM